METGIINDFRDRVSSEIELVDEGYGRFRVFTPFAFDDGDEFSIVLKRHGRDWILTDEGHTFMHLSYRMDERDWQRGTREEIVSNTLSMHQVHLEDGELSLRVIEGDYGNALFSFIQALHKIADLTFLSREMVRSTFREDFKAWVDAHIPADRRVFDWHDPERDPEGYYTVDLKVNGRQPPVFVFAVNNEARAKDATISLLRFENWGLRFRSVGVFEHMEGINRRVLARFMDVADKTYSNLYANKDRLQSYFNRYLNTLEDL